MPVLKTGPGEYDAAIGAVAMGTSDVADTNPAMLPPIEYPPTPTV